MSFLGFYLIWCGLGTLAIPYYQNKNYSVTDVLGAWIWSIIGMIIVNANYEKIEPLSYIIFAVVCLVTFVLLWANTEKINPEDNETSCDDNQ